MKRLSLITSLVFLGILGLPVQSQVETLRSKTMEPNIFNKNKEAERFKIAHQLERDTKLAQDMQAPIFVEDFIEYDAQILSSMEPLAPFSPVKIKETSMEQEDFKIRYRQDGLTNSGQNQDGSKSLNTYPSDLRATSLTEKSIALENQSAYDIVGYYIYPQVKFALGWRTQKPFSIPRTLR